MTRPPLKKKPAVSWTANPPRTQSRLALPSAAGQLVAKRKILEQQMADLALQPSFSAATVALAYLGQPGGELSVTGLNEALKVSIEDISAGDMSRVEAMLLAQAHAMQAIFVDLAGRAARAQRPEHQESLLRMAFKAQNQCRMTLESLATVKDPPVVFARQANIANGPQQINNGVVPTVRIHAHGN